MNMSRKHKVSDNRIIEYFELKYETNVEFGLTSAQVRRRLNKNNAYNVAKEKKQIWLICFKQECRDLLFFIYLCGISWIFDFSERIQITLALIFFFLFILKIKRAFRIKKAFFEQKEINSSKVIVLRDGIFHRMPWQYLLRGDIVRLKKGEEVKENVISLEEPYREYEAGEIFTENTGRAIVTQLTADNFQTEEFERNNILQKLDVWQGICSSNLFKGSSKKEDVENIQNDICKQFSVILKKVEEQIPESLCVFMLLAFALSVYVPQEGDMQRILQTGCLFSVVYIVGKEVVKELFRAWFVQKIKRGKLNYMRKVNKINNT